MVLMGSDSSLLMGGKIYEFTFNKDGDYDYFCVLHPWMKGNVLVNRDLT